MRNRPITKLAPAAALLLAGVLALTACGSDNNGSTNSGSGLGTQAAATDGNQPAGVTEADCVSGTLTADGSTAQQNAMTQWIKDYQSKCAGATITYGGGGSGQGITDFSNGQVDFAGSDAALNPSAGEVDAATKSCGSQAIDLPMVTGPIAVAYNVAGVSKLVLTADEIAKIFTGKITKWDDPQLKATNPGVSLPSSAITVFNRSDASGTTQNFETYLKTSAPSVWTQEPSKQWAGSGQGKSGNQLVGQAIQSTKNSIGYVEWSYAIQNNLPTAEVDNGAGPVQLTADTVAKTVATAQIAPSGPGDLTLKLDYATKVAGAYPIVLVTYEVVCSHYKDSSTGALVKAFLNFIAGSPEQTAVHPLGYAALPTAVQTKVQDQIAKIS
jgi:phosphate transport system substrate-binding protein